MAQKRKPITKKLRFEVFKRDNFTCQYCGRKAPEVVLEVDHIKSVKTGGDNNILNLITSCFDCNRGKGKRNLSLPDELKKQQEQLEQLNERRQQLEMIVKWKQELDKIEEHQVDIIEDLLSETNCIFSEDGRAKCKRAIKNYGFEEVYESAKISFDQYYDSNDETSANKVFNYIWRICAVRKKQKENPNLSKINYLIKIAENRLYYINKIALKSFLKQYFEEQDFENLKEMFIEVKNWTELVNYLEEYYEVE